MSFARNALSVLAIVLAHASATNGIHVSGVSLSDTNGKDVDALSHPMDSSIHAQSSRLVTSLSDTIGTDNDANTFVGDPYTGLCLNDRSFKQFFDGKLRECSNVRLDEDRRIEMCKIPEVFEACPQSCGRCCKDDDSYSFFTKSGKEKGCRWIQTKPDIRAEKYCGMDKYEFGNRRVVRDACPKACNFCFAYSGPRNTFEAGYCANKPAGDFFLEHNSQIVTCESLGTDEDLRKELCDQHTVRNNCPRTCGICW